jgi:hypothetical protein
MTLLQASIALAITIALYYTARLANDTKARLVKHDEKPHP